MDYFGLLKLVNQYIEATFSAQNFPLYPTMPSDNFAYYGVTAQCIHGTWNDQQEMLKLAFKSWHLHRSRLYVTSSKAYGEFSDQMAV